MKYEDKSFTVSSNQPKKYRNNFDKIDWSSKNKTAFFTALQEDIEEGIKLARELANAEEIYTSANIEE